MLKNITEDTVKKNIKGHDQYYYGRGKLLLSGEYFVLEGTLALALPVKLGQSLAVDYRASYSPKIHWKSYDSNGEIWFECKFEFWHFDIISENVSEEAIQLQKILRQVRKQNTHFLREENVDVFVETKIGFPLEWGLGSSSSLIYNIAQWAYISPFELLFNTFGGSGYDIACAQSDGPIVYEKKASGPHWTTINFNPPFKDSLYFIYLGRKQNSREALNIYKDNRPYSPEVIMGLTNLTKDMVRSVLLEDFEFLIDAHENYIAKNIGLEKVKDLHFSDYWGKVKSLGAWGGDFALVTSSKSKKETEDYFRSKGFDVFLSYEDIILESDSNVTTPLELFQGENNYVH